MEQNGQTAPLYDFLYRDASRFASFYAQIFGGHLTTLEQTDATRHATELGGGINFLVSATGKSVSDVATGARRVSNPHDNVPLDVIRRLIADERIHRDLVKAPHGGIVLVTGTLSFFDSLFLQFAASGFEAVIKGMPSSAEFGEEMRTLLGIIAPLIGKLSIPSAFFLQTPESHIAVGTIKEDGLEEPISAYTAKHGAMGLPNVFLFGIKEQASDGSAFPESPFVKAGKQMAQGIRDQVFPTDATRVTPIALYRQV